VKQVTCRCHCWFRLTDRFLEERLYDEVFLFCCAGFLFFRNRRHSVVQMQGVHGTPFLFPVPSASPKAVNVRVAGPGPGGSSERGGSCFLLAVPLPVLVRPAPGSGLEAR